MDKEKLIKSIMADAEKEGEPISKADAEEIAEMEIKASGLKNYTMATPEKKKRTPPKKDETKIAIITNIYNYIEPVLGLENLEIVNDQREISFRYCGADYSLTLTKHRPPKK